MKRLVLVTAVLLFAFSSLHSAPARSFQINGQPDTAFASNVAVDIIRHAGGIWLATSAGINYTLDTGRTWLLYNDANGLVSKDISALFSLHGRLWAATNHDGLVDGSPESFSDALSFTDDNGQTWDTARFNNGIDTVKYAKGPFELFMT